MLINLFSFVVVVVVVVVVAVVVNSMTSLHLGKEHFRNRNSTIF